LVAHEVYPRHLVEEAAEAGLVGVFQEVGFQYVNGDGDLPERTLMLATGDGGGAEDIAIFSQ
jgi:hypothetical protein